MKLKNTLRLCGLLCCMILFSVPVLAGDRTFTDAEGRSLVLRESPWPDFLLYAGERVPFTVAVPTLFSRVVVIPDNGDGVILSDKRGKARFRTSGGELLELLTIRQLFESARESLNVNPAYERLGKNFFVLSWIADGNIHYRKLVLNGDAWCDMEMNYPLERKKEFDPLVTYSAKSLQLRAD